MSEITTHYIADVVSTLELETIDVHLFRYRRMKKQILIIFMHILPIPAVVNNVLVLMVS